VLATHWKNLESWSPCLSTRDRALCCHIVSSRCCILSSSLREDNLREDSSEERGQVSWITSSLLSASRSSSFCLLTFPNLDFLQVMRAVLILRSLWASLMMTLTWEMEDQALATISWISRCSNHILSKWNLLAQQRVEEVWREIEI